MKFLTNLFSGFRQRTCQHFFKVKDMQFRDENGQVKWKCSKCGKLFIEECGLDILRYGECDGNWVK
jgi:hypothetical protein